MRGAQEIFNENFADFIDKGDFVGGDYAIAFITLR